MSIISQKIDYIIRTELHPTLKREGYVKSARTFRKKLEYCTQIVNIQGSWTNIGEEGKFTINLGVYFPEVAVLHDMFSKKDKPLESDCLVNIRIGRLMPIPKDFWWEVSLKSNLDEIAKEINNTWLRYGKDWLDKHSNIQEAINFSLSRKNFFWASIFSIVQGDKNKAKNYLDQAIGDSINHDFLHERLKSWGKRNGLIVEN